MPEFAARRPELAVAKVEIVTALSNAARDKSMDAAALIVVRAISSRISRRRWMEWTT